MIAISHDDLVRNTCKYGEELVKESDPLKMHIQHMALGIAGEAGELVDVIKKHVVYNQPLNIEHLIEELGDLEYYLEGLRARLNISREEVIKANIIKLTKRYPNGFSNAAAKARLDKKVGNESTNPFTDNLG